MSYCPGVCWLCSYFSFRIWFHLVLARWSFFSLYSFIVERQRGRKVKKQRAAMATWRDGEFIAISALIKKLKSKSLRAWLDDLDSSRTSWEGRGNLSLGQSMEGRMPDSPVFDSGGPHWQDIDGQCSTLIVFEVITIMGQYHKLVVLVISVGLHGEAECS